MEDQKLEQDSPQLLRIDPDATRITSLGRTTLYAAIARGDLRVMRVGRAVRIQRDDLEAWIERHMVGPEQGG